MNIEGNIHNILEQHLLKWIFIGGKGGVGKTTISGSLAMILASTDKKILIISTDPAHNLSDIFNQKITKEPTPIKGIEKLYAMEIQGNGDEEKIGKEFDMGNFGDDQGTKCLINEVLSSVPGIDQAMAFTQLIKSSIENMNFDIIIFDTAPTGHTLRFLTFPPIFEMGLNKILALKNKFKKVMGSMSKLFGSKEQLNRALDKIFAKMQKLRNASHAVNQQMKNNAKTTFIAVCIPEFLPMYETERLIQQLVKFRIDVRNIVINQVIYPQDECKMCTARSRMQKKYLDQMLQLYEDFHVIVMPLQEEEIRGIDKLKEFSTMLLQSRQLPIL